MQLIESLFGEPPVLYEDKINYKYPRQGSAFPMHQDYSFWKKYSQRLTSALIYIDDATEENGCLEVVPAWHHKGLLADPSKPGKEQHYIDPKVLDPKLAVKVPGAPGTMILFSCMTPHASQPNYSDDRRRAVIMTFNPASDGDVYYQKFGYADADSWNEHRQAIISTKI